MAILKKLELFRKVKGYLGAGVFTYEGKMLGGVTEISGINFEIAGTLFHEALIIIDNRSKEVGFGGIEMMQVNTEKGIVLGKCYNDAEANIHYHTILVLENDANVAMARLILNKVVEELKEEF
jgi:hypothetical protein